VKAAVLIRDTKENDMQDETTEPKTKPPDREAVRVLAIELGASWLESEHRAFMG